VGGKVAVSSAVQKYPLFDAALKFPPSSVHGIFDVEPVKVTNPFASTENLDESKCETPFLVESETAETVDL